MAEQNTPEKGALVTPASVKLEEIQTKRSSINGAPVTGDILRVAGTTATPPNRQPANMSNQDRALARMNGSMLTAYKPDTNKYNKLTTYNATHHGRNFERYYAHPKFKELGFSPFRDNEAFYNKNSSLWDDAQRGVVTAGKLFGGAFVGSAKNWSNPFSLEPDVEGSDEMARLMSIGSSSRGGFGSSAINFGVNIAYGMGVLGEVLAEEMIIAPVGALLAAPTGGASAALAAIKTSMNIKKLANAFSLGKAAMSFAGAFKGITKINDARQLWGAAKGVGKAVDYLLPFQQSRALLTKSGRAAAKWDSLEDMAKVSTGFGSFYRGVREINAVTYESKLEGGSVQTEVINGLMSDFRKKEGRDPNDQEAQLMHQQGHKAGYLAAQMNAIGIYISNKIVLDKALKGIPGMAQADDVARRTMKGTLLKVQDWAKKGANPWEVVSGVKKYGKAAFYKQTFNPKNLAKGGLGYLSANLMEGTQEVYQEAIANGISSYYMDSFNNPSRVGGAEFRTKMLGGLKSQMSGQGMETFLSGFLMAGPMTAAQSAFFGAADLGRRAKLKMQDKAFKADTANAGKASPFEEQLNAEKDYDNKVVDALNDMTKDPKKYFSAIEQNARTQADLERLGEQAAADGDMHAAKNIKDESLTNHIITMMESGHFEIFQDQLKGLKDLDAQELQEAFDEPGDAKKTVAERIDSVIKRTNQIKETYKKYQDKVNPFSMRQDPLSYMAFEQARHIAIRNDVTYQRTGERMSDILNQFNSDMPFTNANASDFTNLFVVGGTTEGGFARVGLTSEIEILNSQINNLSDSIPEQKAQKDQLTQKRDDLKSLSGTIQAYASTYKVTQSVAQTEAEHAANMDTFIETEKIFKKAYAEYVQNLAKGSGQTVLSSAIDSSFDKLSDFWKLNTDRQDVANAVNMMQNPDMYRNATERLRDAMAIAFERREESLKKALADYKKKHLVNAFFNDLFEKFNVFVEPEEADAYINKDTIPETFYDADTLEEIEPGSAKYRGIMALIDQYDDIYFEETGERLIRTDELSNAERRTGYDVTTNKAVAQEFRPRDAKDKRSIKAIADEFGFNHIDTESSVDATDVLKAIAKSKHGYVPRAQKKLAQALLGFIKPGTQIRFKNGHRTNSTYDATNGIIVDANFSAEGFENANIPIEFSILNAVMQQVASESLSDAAFNDRITSVREQFEEALSDLDKKYFKYALTNNQQFIAEAMTNADLQAEMGKIGYEGELTEQTAEAKSMWESFMDSIYELLEKIFGVTRGKTLYQEAMNVITNKLSQPGVAGPSSVPSVLAENETEEEIDIEEEDDPELEQRLRAKFNEVVAAMSPADKIGMNFESWKQSDSMAVTIRNKYSAEKIKKATAAPSSPTVMTEAEQVRRLTSLGYQISEINNMKKGGQQDEIDNIIKNDTKKKIQIRTVDANGKTVYIEANYDQPIAARPNVAAAIKKALQTLDDANVDLNAAETMYNQRVQTGIDPTTGEPVYKKKDGTPDYERLSHVVKDKFEGTDKESTDRGNIIDLLLRDFLNGDILDIRQFKSAYSKYQSKNSSAAFSQEMLNDLFDKFRSVQILLKSNGLTVISNLPGLFGKIGKKYTAGKIDLIAYDAAGKIYIIDLKTSTQDRRAQYKAETDLENAFGIKYSEIKEAIKGGSEKKKTFSETLASTRISVEDKEKLKKVADANPTVDAMFFYKDQDAKQQNGYRELLRQSTGLVADVLSIFPLVTTKAGKIFTKVEFQKEGKDHSMKVDIYDIHDKLGLVNEATYPENPIDRVAKEAPVTPEPTATPTEKQPAQPNIIDIEAILSKYSNERPSENWASPRESAEIFVPLYEKLNRGEKLTADDFPPSVRDFEEFVNSLDLGVDTKLLTDGKPTILYHGSPSKFGIFKEEFLGTYTNAPSAKQAFFAALDPDTAIEYGERDEDAWNTLGQLEGDNPEPDWESERISELLSLPEDDPKRIQYEAEREQIRKSAEEAEGKYFTVDYDDDTIDERVTFRKRTNLYPLFFISKNPLIVDVKNNRKNIGSINETLIKAKADGYDAVVFKNIIDGGNKATDVYTVFSSSQIKNVIDVMNDRFAGNKSADTSKTYSGKVSTDQSIEQTIADLRAQEQLDLRKAIPDIDNYRKENGDVDKSKLTGMKLAMYNQIYDRYDKLIQKTTKQPSATTSVPEKFDVTQALEEVLNENPELAAIGTAQQYADYLTSVFPETVLKNIFYRGTPNPDMIEAEDIDPKKGTGARNLGIGIYWTPDKRKASSYATSTGRTIAAILNVRNFYITSIESNWSRGFLTPGNLTVSELANGADTLISFKGLDRDTQVAQETGTSLIYIGRYEGPRDEYGLPGLQDFSKAMPTIGELAVNSNEQVHILGSKKDLQGFKDFASKGKPGTQTQMDFDELTLNVGDRVKVNTPKDGEGVIKEDRGDKVLLEDGRQVMKKSLIKLEPGTRQSVVSQVADTFQGKVIVTNFSSSTPLVRDIEGVIYGTDLYVEALPTVFSSEMIDMMSKSSISGERDLSNNLIKAAKILEKPELTADDVKSINSALGLGIYVRNKLMVDTTFPFEDRPKHQQKLLNALAELKEALDNQVVEKAKQIAATGSTVVFDNNSLINHPGIDQVLINKSSDDYLSKGKESKANFDELIADVDYQDITDQDLVDYLRGTDNQQGADIELFTQKQKNPNQAEIDRLTKEYEATVNKRKTYYNSLRQKVGKVSQDVYLNNLKAAEDQELAGLKETYEQALEALGVQRSSETQLENISKMNLPESVLNLRESIAKADRVQLSTLEASLKPLTALGIADVVLKQQNLTKDEVNDLIKNARARLKGTLAHAELVNTIRLRKPLEDRVVYYDTEAGTQAGVLVSFDEESVSVAPYDGKESLSDLQDESKWVTFTVGEIPYKLFYAKTTTPVTATPDITQQSDDLINDEEANKSAVDTLKNDIGNDDFKDQSADDAADDLFDDLNNCIIPE